MKKALLLILPLTLLIINLNKVKADTYTYNYNDPNLVSPPGCNSAPDDLINPDNSPVPCNDSGDRTVKASINYNPSYSEVTNNISITISLSYSICDASYNNCIDGNDPNIYNGESFLIINSNELINYSALDLQFNNNQHHFPITNCAPSNCIGDIYVRSGTSLTFTVNLSSSDLKESSNPDVGFLPIIDNYTVSSGFTPKIKTPNNNPIPLQFTFLSNQIFLNFKCGETSQQIIDNFYKNPSGGDYYNKVYDPYAQYDDYYNNFNTVSVTGINEMLFGNPTPDFTGSDSGSLNSGGEMCVLSGNVPNGYLYNLGDCTPPKLDIKCDNYTPILRLR